MSQSILSVQDNTLRLFVRDPGYAWGPIGFGIFLGIVPVTGLCGLYEEWSVYHPTVWYVTAILFMIPLCLLFLFGCCMWVRKGLKKPVTTELCLRRSAPGKVLVTYEQSFLLAQKTCRSAEFVNLDEPLAYTGFGMIWSVRESRSPMHFAELYVVAPSGEEYNTFDLSMFHETHGGATYQQKDAIRFVEFVNAFVVYGDSALDDLKPEDRAGLGLVSESSQPLLPQPPLPEA